MLMHVRGKTSRHIFFPKLLQKLQKRETFRFLHRKSRKLVLITFNAFTLEAEIDELVSKS